MLRTSWKQVAKELPACFMERKLSEMAAALAYYLIFSIFPMMIVLLAVLPYLPIPNLQGEIMGLLQQAMPGEAAELFTGIVNSITSEKQGGLLSVGLLVALWAGSNGFAAIISGLNSSYGVTDQRSFIKVRGVAIGLMMASGAFLIFAFSLIILGGVIQTWLQDYLALGSALVLAFDLLRWFIVLILISSSLAFMYYVGPDVEQQFKFITPGSILATLLMIGASLLFRWYVSNFADYSATYGSIGAVIVLMLWLYITGLILLLGASVNALAEHFSVEGKNLGQRHVQDEALDGRRPISPHGGDAPTTA